MDLLDSDSEIIEKNNEKKPKKKSGRKAKNSGLNRFASSLNKYKKLTDEHRKKQEAASDNEGIKRTQPAKPKKVMSNEQPSTPPNELKPENETVNNEKKTTHKSQPAKPKIAKSTKQPHEDTFKDESLTIEPSETYKDETSTKETFITNELKGNKEVTNKPQMDNQLEYKEITNKPQMDNQKVTKGVQRGNSTDNKTDNVSANFTSPTALTDNDPRLLMGQNKKLLEIFFADCKSTGSLTTGRFTREYISNALNTTPNQVKTVLNRLVKRGFVERLPGKRGRAGWVQIQIPQDIYEQLIYMENSSSLSRVNDEMLVNKITKGITERVTNPSSSSSNLNNNLTTTTKPLPEEWQFIQIPDVLKENGFSMAHIKQLYGDHFLSSDEVQDSLDAFAFDLSEGNIEAKTTYIRMFMGIVRKRNSPYVSQALIEQEKKELEEYTKKIEEAKEARQQRAEIALVKKFEEMWSALSQEQKNEIAPPSNYIEEGSDMQERIARGRYLEDQSILG